MALTQQTFLGLSISQINANIGWGGSTGSLDLVLVEDDANGDEFTSPIIGSPQYFAYDNFSFGGILQHYSFERNDNANPICNVTINDPSELLDCVQVIFGNYTGTINNIANVVNVFGHLENAGGFGASQRNDAGIPYYIARQGIVQLLAAVIPIINSYSLGRIKFRGYSYVIDFSELPPMNINYRIESAFMSLLEFVQTVCNDAGYDFFVRLEYDPNFGGGGNAEHVIKLKTVSRVAQPPLGQISTFIQSQSDINSLSSGVELRNDVTTTFLVGGQQQKMWQMWSSHSGGAPSTSGEEFETIWPFWGLDANGNAIIGRGNFYEPQHSFTIDMRHVYLIGIGDTYQTDVGEMRAALENQAAWEYYVEHHHPDKAVRLGMVGPYRASQELLEELAAVDPADPRFKITQTHKFLHAISQRFTLEDINLNIGKLYEFISNFANEYYGKKFMVRIPDVAVAAVPDTLDVIYSLEPSDGGWPDDGEEALGLSPGHVDSFRLDDDRLSNMIIHPAVSGFIDLSKWDGQDSIVFQNRLYGKVSIDPQVYFVNADLAYNPRVVITLPDMLKLSEEWMYTEFPTSRGSALLRQVLDGVGLDPGSADLIRSIG